MHYLRYIDDICLLSNNPSDIRRALIHLDLKSKELGLVPQAQKITAPIKAGSAAEITTSLPSMVLSASTQGRVRQRDLQKLFSSSTAKRKREWYVTNKTHFKFAIGRLNAKENLVPRVLSLAKNHPEYAREIGRYLSKFGVNDRLANEIAQLLDRDPVYDSTATSYIGALDACSGSTPAKRVNAILQKVCRLSVEQTIPPRIAVSVFRGKRSSTANATNLIRKANNPLAKSMILDQLFGTSPDTPFSARSALSYITELCKSSDADLARYAAYLGVTYGPPNWRNPVGSNTSVNILLYSTGHISARVKRSRILDVFFQIKCGITVKLNWTRALGSSLRQMEKYCLQLQAMSLGNQEVRILLIDSFNDGLLQHFCPLHPNLKVPYQKAAGGKHHPDFGAWLNQKDLGNVIPNAAKWFKAVHDARVKIPLAHFADKQGTINKFIKKSAAETLLGGSTKAWAALLVEWQKHL